MEMYQRLVTYKAEHNDIAVPRRYKEDPQLGIWVYAQRIAYRNNKMTERHKHLVESVGFEWDGKAAWEEMYQRLVA